MSGVFQKYWPPPPSPPGECIVYPRGPAFDAGGGHTHWVGRGVRGQYFGRRQTQLWARICKPFKEPRNRFPASRAGTTTLFDVLVRLATLAVEIDFLKSIPGLLNRLQIQALNSTYVSTMCHLLFSGRFLLCRFKTDESFNTKFHAKTCHGAHGWPLTRSILKYNLSWTRFLWAVLVHLHSKDCVTR